MDGGRKVCRCRAGLLSLFMAITSSSLGMPASTSTRHPYSAARSSSSSGRSYGTSATSTTPNRHHDFRRYPRQYSVSTKIDKVNNDSSKNDITNKSLENPSILTNSTNIAGKNGGKIRHSNIKRDENHFNKPVILDPSRTNSSTSKQPVTNVEGNRELDKLRQILTTSSTPIMSSARAAWLFYSTTIATDRRILCQMTLEDFTLFVNTLALAANALAQSKRRKKMRATTPSTTASPNPQLDGTSGDHCLPCGNNDLSYLLSPPLPKFYGTACRQILSDMKIAGVFPPVSLLRSCFKIMRVETANEAAALLQMCMDVFNSAKRDWRGRDVMANMEDWRQDVIIGLISAMGESGHAAEAHAFFKNLFGGIVNDERKGREGNVEDENGDGRGKEHEGGINNEGDTNDAGKKRRHDLLESLDLIEEILMAPKSTTPTRSSATNAINILITSTGDSRERPPSSKSPKMNLYMALVDAYVKNNNLTEAVVLAKSLILEQNTLPSQRILDSIFHGFIRISPDKADVWTLFNHIRTPMTRGDNSFVIDMMMKFLCSVEDFDCAFAMFERMGTVDGSPFQYAKRSIYSWNIYLQGLIAAGRLEQALGAFYGMPFESDGISPNLVTFNILLHGLMRYSRIDEVLELLDEMVKRGIQADVVTYSSLIDSSFKCGRPDLAQKWFDQMQANKVQPSVVTLTSLIDGYGKSGDMASILTILKSVNLSSIVSQSDKLGAVEVGSNGAVAADVILYTAALGAFSKAGDETGFNAIVDSFQASGLKPDVPLFNLMLAHLFQRGNLDDVRRMVETMESQGFNPDSYSATTLIHGLVTAGHVRAGEHMALRFAKIGGNFLTAHSLSTLLRGFIRTRDVHGIVFWVEMALGENLITSSTEAMDEIRALSLAPGWKSQPRDSQTLGVNTAASVMDSLDSIFFSVAIRGLTYAGALLAADIVSCWWLREVERQRSSTGLSSVNLEAGHSACVNAIVKLAGCLGGVDENKGSDLMHKIIKQ
ncbi:hypothetical protein HDU76_013475 [Blyttiomyces sp. JEL0837]|nr:hypothetical protein HDU76_013475 [Blyttiomyces sp. JEL0837]